MIKTGIIWSFIAFILALLWLHIPSVVVPFVIAFILAFALDPVMNFLAKCIKLPRSISAIVVILLFIFMVLGALFMLVPIVYSQIYILVKKIPAYRAFVDESMIPYVVNKVNNIDPKIADSARETFTQSVDDIFAIFVGMLNNLWGYTIATINVIICIFLIPVLLFYFLRDWGGIKESFYSYFPKNSQKLVKSIFSDIGSVLSSYIRGQLFVCMIWSIYYYVAFSIMDLDLAFILAIMSGLAPIIPVVGATIALISSLVVGYFQFGAGAEIIYILVIQVFGSMVDGTYLTPKIIGSRIGLSPVWIVFSVFTMSYILGPVGLLLGIPTAGIVSVILRYATQNYKESELYNKKK